MSIPKIAGYPMPVLPDSATSRVRWQPDPQRAVLLIHDMQQYFVNFFDQNAEPVPTLLDNILALRHFCDSAGIPVIYTAQPPQQTPQQRGLLQDWWGPGLTAFPEQAGIVELLAPRPQDTVLTKWRYSAFYRSDLQERMQAVPVDFGGRRAAADQQIRPDGGEMPRRIGVVEQRINQVPPLVGVGVIQKCRHFIGGQGAGEADHAVDPERDGLRAPGLLHRPAADDRHLDRSAAARKQRRRIEQHADALERDQATDE